MFSLQYKLKNPHTSWFDRTEAKIKLTIYTIMHEIMQFQINSPYVFNMLIVIEAGQFLWYTIHPDFPFLWTSDFSNYPRDVVKYFQLDTFLREGTQSFFYAALYIVFSIQLIMFFFVLFVIIKLEDIKKKSSTFIFYIIRLLMLYSYLLKTVATLPFMEILFAAVICREGNFFSGSNECYQGTGIINMAVGIASLVILLPFSLLSQTLCMDLNPASSLPFAAPSTRVDMYKLAMKIAVALYSVLDQKLEQVKVFTPLYLAAWAGILLLRYKSQGYYNKMSTLYTVAMEAVIFWSCVVANFHAFIINGEENSTGLYFLLILSPFCAYVYYKIFGKKNWFTLTTDLRKSKKGIEIEEYVLVATQIVKEKDNPEGKIQLEGLIRFHSIWCNSNDCPCKELALSLEKDEDIDVATWYIFIKSILVEGLIHFPKNAKLHLLHAYLQQENLNNKFKALYELMITEGCRPNIQEEFSVFRYRNLIEKEMEETEIREALNKELDVKVLVLFQEKFVSLQNEISRAVNMQLDFWRELEQTSPSVQKLLSLGSQITVQADKVKSTYMKLSELNSNNIKMLQTYGNFLKDIMNDTFESQRLLEKASYIEGSLAANKKLTEKHESNHFKYSENSNTCIFTCSGNMHTLGIIQNVNTEITKTLGYQVTDLIGENIKGIMPHVIAEIHNDLMKRYLDTSKEVVLGKEWIVFPQSKAGYIIPCTLLLRIFPNLSEGIKIVGFLHSLDWTPNHLRLAEESQSNVKAHYILYGGENNSIYGISEGCSQSFGIPVSLVSGDNHNYNEFTIDKIFPDLLQQNNEELTSTTGLVLTLDTSTLPHNFLFDRETDSDDEEAYEKMYRKARVRTLLIEDSLYLNKVPVRVLKFVEVANEGLKNLKNDVQAIGDNKDKKVAVGDYEGSDGSMVDASRSEASNISVGSSVGDDIRQLKDMKAQISEKRTPSSILSLQKLTFIMFAALISLTSVQLSRKSGMNTELKEGIISTRSTYLRDDLLAQINMQARNLELLQADLSQYSFYAPTKEGYKLTLKNQLEDLNHQMNQIEFTIGQGRLYIVKKDPSKVPSISNNIKTQLKDGSLTSLVMDYSQSMYYYVQNAESYNKFPPNSADALRHFYYIKTNGFGPLRIGAEEMNKQFLSFYESETENFSQFFLITMCVGIAVVALSLLFIIPKIFSVNLTNMKVLSLFGYIPPDEVHELARQCQQYLNVYLDDMIIERSFQDYSESHNPDELEASLESSKHRATYLEFPNKDMTTNFNITQNKDYTDKDDRTIVNKSSTQNMLTIPDQSVAHQRSTMQLINRDLAKEEKLLMTDQSPQRKKEKESNDEEDEELLEQLQERSRKLRDSKSHNKGLIMFKIAVFASLFIVYYVVDYVLDAQAMKDFKKGIEHLKSISERLNNLRWTVAFALEEIAENDLSVVYPDTSELGRTNYQIRYENAVYMNQNEVKNALKTGFPDTFDDYFSKLTAYNNGDACTLFYSTDLNKRLECLAVGIGNIAGGLIQSEVSLVGYISSTLTNFYGKNPRDTQAQIDAINGKDFRNSVSILNAISPMLNGLIDEYLGAFDRYLSSVFTIQRIKFAIFFVVLLGILIVWIPYLGKLKNQIFRTKGLLNMIPMTMLKKNRNLREIFRSNEILKAIR